jgi:hypothetical protein
MRFPVSELTAPENLPLVSDKRLFGGCGVNENLGAVELVIPLQDSWEGLH